MHETSFKILSCNNVQAAESTVMWLKRCGGKKLGGRDKADVKQLVGKRQKLGILRNSSI